jgi:hypothetical protein
MIRGLSGRRMYPILAQALFGGRRPTMNFVAGRSAFGFLVPSPTGRKWPRPMSSAHSMCGQFPPGSSIQFAPVPPPSPPFSLWEKVAAQRPDEGVILLNRRRAGGPPPPPPTLQQASACFDQSFSLLPRSPVFSWHRLIASSVRSPLAAGNSPGRAILPRTMLLQGIHFVLHARHRVALKRRSHAATQATRPESWAIRCHV